MEKVNELYKRIWELKTQSHIKDVKAEIQKLQQTMDSAENLNKTNSAKYSTEIEEYLYKRNER